MSETGCPVCGYPDFSERYAHGGSTYDICPSCGFGSGTDGIGWDREERDTSFRQRWIDSGAQWHSRVKPPPPNWNPLDQLRAAGLHDTDEAAGDHD